MARRTKALILTAASVLALSACGYQGSYRYECQDPENWENPECNPPACRVNGDCWRDLVDYEEEQP